MKLFTFSLLMVMQIFAFSIRFSFAVTAYPHPVEYELPDGTVIKIRLKGDEKIKWAETLDGYSILMNDEGFYEYAILDSNGDMLRSGIRVSPIEKRTQNETNWLSKTDKGLMFSQSQVGLMKQIWNIKREEALKTFPTTGNRKLVCILIGFTDKAFTKTQTEFNNLFNQVGYTTGGATGSVKDYYLENSYNQFNLTVDVAGPFTASNNMAYYGANNANGNDIRPRELAAEAVNLADPIVNYSNYDNDGDGWVDGVYMIYAGYGEDAGASPNTIWSHAWYLITPLYKDGVYISRYSCSPELRGNSGTTITAIGVICHEFGHVLGAPDYYDTDYATGGQYTGTGQWDMMAEGSWNNNGVTPAHHNGYTKVYYYQWASATTLSTGQNITLSNASQNSNSFYRYNTTTTNEFFLLENREMHLFDSYIPGSGMIIYHVHSGVNAVGNTINATHPQRMYPVSQNATSDPTSTPSSYGNINSANCAWNGTGKTSFTDATLPSSKSWAGANTNKPITSISRNANAKTVSFVFMGGGQSGPTISVSPTSLTQMLPANQTITQIVTVSNTGGSALTFNLAVNSTANSINELPENNDNTSYNLPVGGDRSSPFAQDTFADVEILPQINKMPGASYTENFDDITTLPSSGWALINKSSPAGTISWFQGSGTIFPAQSGAATSYIGANYNSTSGTGTISNWLISPVTAFQNGHSFSFWTRTTTASSWPDRLEVRLSSNGSSTNVGTLATDVGDFSTLIFSVNPTLVTGGYPETWTQYTVTLSGITGTINGRIGFRYFVTNGGPSGNNSNYIGIDSFTYNGGTTPSGWLSASPLSGTVAAGQSTQITVTFNSAGLSNGTYQGSLVFNSNDATNPTITVPVTLFVGGFNFPPPRNLTGDATGSTVNLAWVAPDLGRATIELIKNNKDYTSNTSVTAINHAENGSSSHTENAEINGRTIIDPKGIKELQSYNPQTLLFNNGSFINSPGTGPGGSDQSVLQTSSLGMNTYGAGVQYQLGNRLAEDFTVDVPWNIENFTFYTYQTGSTTVSTITGCYMQIWNGDPTTGGTVVWGDLTTNLMASTAWTNCYRVSQTDLGTTRPIMSVICNTNGLTLNPGTYWVDFTIDGSLASGPWGPPITINGQTVTGNGKQYTNSTSSWQDFLDTGTSTGQGFPFLINGTTGGSTNYNLIGYKVYKNGTLINTLPPNILTFTENNVVPGTYSYGVSAIYDQPAQGESDVVTTSVTVILPSLAVTPSNQNVSATAGSTSFTVTSNTSWTVTESVLWLTVSPMSGSNNGTLTVNYDANPTTSSRTGQITVTASGGSPSVIVTVTQAGLSAGLTITPSNQNVSATAGSTSFTVTSNTSWTVTESVLWLTVSPMSGSNNGTLTVNYDANPTTSSRTGQITVTAGGGSPAVTVTVTQSGLQVCLPPWQPVTNLQYNMQVIGQIFIDGSLSGNSDDFVGAFVGNECRGMASPDPTSGLVFLTIGSNTASGDQLLFKVWRSDQCSECPTSAQMTFQNQLLVGTPSEPFAFNCGLEELNLSFGQGYTWFSVNVNPGSMAVSSLFANLNPCQNNRIIGQSSFALYFNGTWMGSLTSISPSQMYKMELCSQQDITIQGLGVPISPINLGAGYTWLGYLPQDCLGTNIAFNGLSPAPAVNNRIIGQTNFAIFFGGSWMGSLTQLCPGKGYVTELSSNSILTYPASSKNYINESPETLISPSGIIPNTATKQHNMNIVAQVLNPEGEILDATGLELIAFIGDECRGVIATDSYSDGLLFLTVGSDFEAGELIHFKVWLPETDQMMDIKETILFEAYRLLGNPAEPFTLSTYGLTGTTDLNENSTFFSEPYPNPFTHETIIDYSISKPAKISLTVFDGLGQKINYQEIYNKEKGKFQLILQRNDLKAGIYHYRIVVKNDLDQIHKTGKLIVW